MKDFTQLADLAAERLGGRVLDANDAFFAPKENLLQESNPIFIEGKYTARGKWMDGWETRRRRTPGYDWCVIRLGLPGIIRGIVVDTSFFTGNYPERFSLEGCELGDRHPYAGEKSRLRSEKTTWIQIFGETSLKGDSRNLFAVESGARFTHLRLKIYPDGGVARLRVHGEALPGAELLSHTEINLVAVENGGSVLVSSDQFYGAPRNLLMPDRAKNMGDGWETKRRRGPGHDWVILKLGVPGTIHRVEVDTAHFKGNYPDSCALRRSPGRKCFPTPSSKLIIATSSQNFSPLAWRLTSVSRFFPTAASAVSACLAAHMFLRIAGNHSHNSIACHARELCGCCSIAAARKNGRSKWPRAGRLPASRNSPGLRTTFGPRWRAKTGSKPSCTIRRLGKREAKPNNPQPRAAGPQKSNPWRKRPRLKYWKRLPCKIAPTPKNSAMFF
jgi:allantoicase